MGACFAGCKCLPIRCRARDSERCCFRDTFYDCQEGDSTKDYLFTRPVRKLSVYGGLGLNWSGRLRRPNVAAGPVLPGGGGVLGSTIPECRHADAARVRGLGAIHWSKGDGSGFMVRSRGNDGHRNTQKEPSVGAFYECVSVDILRAGRRIGRVIGELTGIQSQGPWEHALPRVLCINVQLPYRAPYPFRPHPRDDHGCSLVAMWRIKGETLDMLSRDAQDQPVALRLFKDFIRGGTTDLPNPGPRTAGLLKAIARVENADEVAKGIPWPLKSTALRQNGKPTLLTQSGSVFKDSANNGEWVEIGIDVRRFCVPARQALVQLRDHLRTTSVHIGFLIQNVGGSGPEGIVCDVHLHCMDIVENPTWVA